VDEHERLLERLEQFRTWQALIQDTQLDMAALVQTALTSSAMLGLATLLITFILERPDARPVLFAAMLPVLVLGVGALALTTRLVIWKIDQWTEEITQSEEPEPQPETIRLVTLNRRREIGGVDAEDLEHFVRSAYETHLWAQKSWRGREMASGRHCNDEYHRQMIAVLEGYGILCDYGERSRGYLNGTLENALAMLGLGDVQSESSRLARDPQGR